MEQIKTGLGKGDITSPEFKTTAKEQLEFAEAQLDMVMTTDKDDAEKTTANLKKRINELKPLAKAEEEAEKESLDIAA